MIGSLRQYVESTFKDLTTDQRGVSAIEFAFVFPLLIVLYIGAFEITVAYSVYKRVSHSAGTIADLVSQQSTIDKNFLATTPSVAAAIFAPFKTNGFKLKITGILTDASSVARVQWSWSEANTRPYTNGSVVNLPASMRNPGRFFVRTELEIPHAVLRFMTDADSAIELITLRREYIFEKRQDEAIVCSNC